MRRLKDHTGRLPYISSMSLYDEEIVVTNPRNMPLNLGGWYIKDNVEQHRFGFPDDYTLPGQRSVVIYTCPGKKLPPDSEIPDLHLMWKTSTGALRKAEVMNNEGDVFYLYTPQDKLASRMILTAEEEVHSPYTVSAITRFGLPYDIVRNLVSIRVALELATCYALFPLRREAVYLVLLAANVVDWLAVETGRSGSKDSICDSMTKAADMVRRMNVLVALSSVSSITPASFPEHWSGYWCASCLPLMLVLEALSVELHRYRSNLSPYRDTIDVVLQGSVYFPKLISYSSDAYLLLWVEESMGGTWLPPEWAVTTHIVLLAGFILNHLLSLVQLVDATTSIAKR